MNDLELVKSLLQMGAAGILIIAGREMLRFLREERGDRTEEREGWFTRMDSLSQHLTHLTERITEALQEARQSHEWRCPFTGADRVTVEEFERRMKEKR